jgi:hypothetical protein
MRPVTKPGFVLNFLILAAVVSTSVVCGAGMPHTWVWVVCAGVTAVLSVLWVGRWVFLWLVWAAARMLGLGEKP